MHVQAGQVEQQAQGTGGDLGARLCFQACEVERQDVTGLRVTVQQGGELGGGEALGGGG